MKKSFNLSRGFTLVELLVVIAVIGILAVTILVNLGGARAKARDARRVSEIGQIQLALEAYADVNANVYPNFTATSQQATWNTQAGAFNIAMDPYIVNLPIDPTNTGVFQYQYAVTGGGTGYQLAVELEHTGGAAGKPAALGSDADLAAPVNGANEACAAVAVDCVYDVGR